MPNRSNVKTAKAIEDVLGASSTDARRLVRTESTYIANSAEMESYRELDIEKYEFVATLDMRTSDVCSALDGKTFPVKDGVSGVNMPPLHPFCRSTTIGVIDGTVLRGLKCRAKNRDGSYNEIPAELRYSQWKKEYVDKLMTNGYNRYRKVHNIGEFKILKEPMQKKHVLQIIKEMGIDYSGIEVDIIRDADLIGSGLMGFTFPNGKKIQLYPDAFMNREELVKTIGHERIHCEQIKLFGPSKSIEEELYYESGPLFSEEYWWSEYVRRTGYGK